MKRVLLGVAVIAGMVAMSMQANAGSRGYYKGEGAHKSSRFYRGGPKVKGYVRRRGGYSYKYQDSINTYGDSRSNYGGVNAYRDFNSDRQTNFGPFDNGFFFNSGVSSTYGGSSPYMH
ncbi:MAG: hypothetical protein K0U74_12775 [Alphaproteobacteria bacterium]|nr:hypothetical protein [Alphaproteobacteria bacterium]